MYGISESGPEAQPLRASGGSCSIAADPLWSGRQTPLTLRSKLYAELAVSHFSLIRPTFPYFFPLQPARAWSFDRAFVRVLVAELVLLLQIPIDRQKHLQGFIRDSISTSPPTSVRFHLPKAAGLD